MARVILVALLVEAALAAQSTRVCACPDGRHFSVGGSMFGRDSARVLITGLRPEQPKCTDLEVVGQVIRLKTSFDRRPYLQRDILRRGIIESICQTKIRFVEAKKSYDFFADDGTAVNLTDTNTTDANQTPDLSPPAQAETEPASGSEDLTGKDLLRLMSSGSRPGSRPENSVFNEEDLKEGAYFIVRKRVKARVAIDDAQLRSQGQPREINVDAGSLGRIEKRAGMRSQPLWQVEILPDSAPLPFWRMLESLPARFRNTRELPGRVILASSQIVEINRFLDQFHVEWTRFGGPDSGVSSSDGIDPKPPTMRLQEIFTRPKMPLEQNVTIARRSGALALIQNAALGLVLISKDPGRSLLVMDESRPSAAPNLMRRQCFMKVDRIEPGEALAVTGADVRIFQPPTSWQVPPDYYAVDLDLRLQTAPQAKVAPQGQPVPPAKPVPLVCRFPSAPIDSGLVDSAERILSRRFDIRKQP